MLPKEKPTLGSSAHLQNAEFSCWETDVWRVINTGKGRLVGTGSRFIPQQKPLSVLCDQSFVLT